MCTSFVGTITGVDFAKDVELSVLADALTAGASAHTITFSANTTTNPTPTTSDLADGPWFIGDIGAGESITYTITLTGGGPMSGGLTMRAEDAYGVEIEDRVFLCAVRRMYGLGAQSGTPAGLTAAYGAL